MPDGSYRGAALNVAARLCGRALGGEVIVSEGTSRLAGRLGGIQYSDRGRVHLKNIPEPIHILQAYSELDAPPANRWVLMFFGKPGRTLGWKLGLAVVLVAAADGRGRRLPHDRRHTEGSNAAPPRARHERRPGDARRRRPLWLRTPGSTRSCLRRSGRTARLQTVPQPKAIQTAVCLPPTGCRTAGRSPRTGAASDLMSAYRSELRRHAGLDCNTGQCNAFAWGGELQWLHGADKPGGRAFCYFDGNDAVIVWTHQRLGQLDTS